MYAMFFSRRVSVVLIPFILSGLAGLAKAVTAPVTFAQFSQDSSTTNSNEFVYTNISTVAGATLTTSTVSIPVIFDFESISGLAMQLQGAQDATLKLTTVSTTTPVTQIPVGSSATLGVEPITGNGIVSQVLTITRDSAATVGTGTKSILLQMTFTGELGGLLNSHVPVLQGSTASGNTVSYASDFLSFDGSASNDFNLAFSSWNTDADNNGLEVATDGLYSSATASGAATFDTTIMPITIGGGLPEPTGLALIAVGAFGLIGRRRRAAR